MVGVKDTSNRVSTDVSVGIGVEKSAGVGRIASMAWVTTGVEGLGLIGGLRGEDDLPLAGLDLPAA